MQKYIVVAIFGQQRTWRYEWKTNAAIGWVYYIHYTYIQQKVCSIVKEGKVYGIKKYIEIKEPSALPYNFG